MNLSSCVCNTIILGMVDDVPSPSSLEVETEESATQGHPLLHSEVQANMGHVRL